MHTLLVRRSRVLIVTIFTSLIAVFAVSGGATAAPPRVAPATSAPTAATIKWAACYGDFFCGRVRVPLDYDEPGGRQISIALIKLPATDPARRIGSLFVNPGGPGGSGVEFVRDAGPFLFTSEVRARFDIVGFDPRGINLSTPLQCSRRWSRPRLCCRRSPTRTQRRRSASGSPTSAGSIRPAPSGVAAS